ncbi:TolC family protein [Nafulsella turpanensis]|uniref:TolC family protein n=1 Tax=Nafulsella turpanensis TaxID=1265690 RepID=UPI000345EC94|nr:TolC family protein [Nafulsella turpanensis]
MEEHSTPKKKQNIPADNQAFTFLHHPSFPACSASRLLLPVFFLLSLIACTPETSKVALPLEPPEAFSLSGESEAPERWWRTFNDPELNTMLSHALDSNFSLMIAWQRFKAAEAVVDRESSYLFPDIEASLQGGTSYPQPDFVGGENIRFGLSSAYEADIWGRIRARIEAEEFRAEASFFDYRAAAVSLSAEVAQTWYQLLATWQQLEIVERQIETNEKILELIRARFGSGMVRGVDILRQEQLLEAGREQLILLESRIEVLEHQLTVLLGLPPTDEMDYLPDTLPALPPLPATGIPAELIQRRPDVQVAFLLLKAADREVAAAISDQYPRFSISGAVSARANSAEALFQDWAYSLAGNLLAPLFYGGRLSAEVERSRAVKEQLLYEYGQTVLFALQEVEDALVLERKQQERIEVLIEQLELAEQTYEQLQIEYFNGLRDYLDVLTALDQEQELRRNLVSAKLALIEYRIALYQALSGGFETEREPEDEPDTE